ncbi:sulfite exporter TauE/SafE family protein [Neobacillus notoginsengisoli]|uniref:Probable membrane transporter protein n=1 Tax=Neobacillus notoginsengisoli TaxID=1578198 RepID=A0A417YTC0_9BACI|nr:sulfite exporter TauE/SafE family protein [Neobacillus notoginsengisoli]RHW40318.1 sulfite exporter TauE/SafE family protein [Neobacillus notoginsengisoli]
MEYIALFFIGICATAIGTLIGGGGIVNLPAMLLLGMPVHSAIGANKVSNTVSSLSSFYYLYRNKQISIKESYWIIPVSLAGGMSGGFIASKISSENMNIVALIFLIFAFLASFLSKRGYSGNEPLKMNKVSVPGLYGIGIYDGLFGPGQGTLMFYLLGYLNISYVKAVGLVRFATFSSCIGAAAMYISTGKIIWPMTFALMAGSVTGAQLGVRIAEKLNPLYVKPILGAATIVLIIQVVGKMS